MGNRQKQRSACTTLRLEPQFVKGGLYHRSSEEEDGWSERAKQRPRHAIAWPRVKYLAVIDKPKDTNRAAPAGKDGHLKSPSTSAFDFHLKPQGKACTDVEGETCEGEDRPLTSPTFSWFLLSSSSELYCHTFASRQDAWLFPSLAVQRSNSPVRH
jgi:hypothetical protein